MSTGDKPTPPPSHDEIRSRANPNFTDQQAQELSQRIYADMQQSICGTPEAREQANKDLQAVADTLNKQNDNGASAMLVNEQLHRNGFPNIQIVDTDQSEQTNVRISESFDYGDRGVSVYSWDATHGQLPTEDIRPDQNRKKVAGPA